jgi:hypothetical protein
MDFSQLVKGQKLSIECINHHKVTFDASLAFKKNSTITCSQCNTTIDLDTTGARKDAEKIMKDLKKMFSIK